MKIEILLADDQFLILEGIKAILEPEPELEVVGTARDGRDAIALVKKLRPDILLIDIEMPNMNGISATKYICKYFPNTKVIVLTSHKNQDYIAEALLAGASGYVWKGNLIEDLKQEICSFGGGYSSVKAKLLTDEQSHMRSGLHQRDIQSGIFFDSLLSPSNGCIPTDTFPEVSSIDWDRTAKEDSTANMVQKRKTIYFKKYRKNIYKPAVDRKQQRCLYPQKLALRSRQTLNRRSAYSHITKADSDPSLFEPVTSEEIGATAPKNFSLPKFNRRKRLKRIVWLLLVISSIVLSILVF